MPQDEFSRVTELLRHWKEGDEQALKDVLPLVYQELRRLAHYHLQSERADHSLQSTALVHEAYLRLVGAEPGDLQNRAHFVHVLGISRATVDRDWATARVWLHRQVSRAG